ncbi:DUF6907 domain-containing protein [Streptomyces chryseus]
MSADRTVTVLTNDHGPLTIPEPAWCVGHDGQPPEDRADTLHTGPDRTALFRGVEIASACLTLSPFSELTPRRTGVSVSCGHLAQTLSPSGLDELAAVMVAYAGTLRGLARQLATVNMREGQ